MIFWIILLGLSILGIAYLLSYRMFKPNEDDLGDIHHFFSSHGFHESLYRLKKFLMEVIGEVIVLLEKGFVLAYDKIHEKTKNTKISDFIIGKGELKQREISSSFLKDVKEYKDKIREEMSTGETPVPEENNKVE
jgi:hypothetical protein